MYIPINLGTTGSTQTIGVNLLDSNGNIVSRQTSTIAALAQNDVFVGILSDQNTGFSPLFSVPLPNQGGTMIVESLNASTMPAAAAVLKNFDLIVLDNFTTSNLSGDQLTALQTWVNQGGALIEAGGSEWRRTLSALPASLLPVTITGTGTLPAGSRLLPVGGAIHVDPTINASVTVSTAQLLGGTQGAINRASTVLASGGIPLIVQERQGEGIICYIAFDPTLEPVVNWAGANTLWKRLVERALGDKLLNSSSYVGVSGFQTAGLGGLLQNLVSNNYPSPWLLLLLVLSYLVVLGPVRLLIIRWRKQRDWSWRIVLSSIIVFSLLTYGLAIEQKGASILSNSVSIVQLNQGASTAHITTYIGVFVLNQGDYAVHIPGNGLVQPSTDQNFSGPTQNSGSLTTISAGQNGTDVNLQGVTFSTVRSLIADRDRAIQGGIDSHLTLQNGVLSGTVTNTLSYGLSDVYVLMSNGFARVGHLSAGQSTAVKLVLSSSANNSGTTLADQLATSNGLQVPYNGSPVQNELQRHLAILSALSSEGGYSIISSCGGGIGPCKVVSYPVVSSNGTAVYTSGWLGLTAANGGRDPLLVTGSPATLIGWADRPTDTTSNVTINGTSPAGLQETLVQSPLNINFSGTLSLPTNFSTGQLIDVQGNTAQTQDGGVYTMTTGSMTFEFTANIGSNSQVSGLTISEPANAALTAGSPGGTAVDASHLQAYLYNWQTSSWDTITLIGFNFSTPNTRAYISPDGQVLLRLANQDTSVGTIFFGKPTLDLQGSVS
jgi:hypothetical protein